MITLCIASRGRHKLLAHTMAVTLGNAVRDDTRVMVAIDDDDPFPGGNGLWPDALRADYTVAPRDLTLGEKYNRAFNAALNNEHLLPGSSARPGRKRKITAVGRDGDLFVPFVDAVGITTPGWDQILVDAAAQFDDGIGAVYFGERRDPLSLPRMQGITRKFIEVQGFFMPEGFPFWWYDTHSNEVSWLSRRVIYADVQLEPTPPTKKTRGARDIKFWGDAYYALRGERYDIAARIVAASDYPAWQRAMIMQEIPYWGEILNNREAQTTRDVAWAAQYEQQIGFDAPADTRYNKAKALMVERLAARQQQAAE